MPRVSVILNCYNHERWVAEAIESVLAQSFRDFELILIDNGATDGSRAVLEHYDDPRIRRFFHDRNESLSKRLNQGVAEAKGEFVAVLYSDDMMLPEKLERQVAMFDALPADYGVVYCPAIGLNQFSGERWVHPSFALEGDISSAMFDRFFDGPVDMSSPLTRTRCFRELSWHEDLFGDGEAVFLRIALDWKFHFDPKPTVILRDHDHNLGKAIQRNSDMHLTILDRMAIERALPAPVKKALVRHRARYAVNAAWSYARLGGENRGWTWDKLNHAVRSSPATTLRNWRCLTTLGLSILPKSLARSANSLGNRLRPAFGNRGLIDSH